MAYEAYDRFIEAAKQFPRWTNLRRRPIDSNAGKILRSVVEEIAKVEDAIIEYKKDFFLVNYIGREDTIVDYVYYAQVGDIEDLSVFSLEDPSYPITEDESAFYRDKTIALYKDGYIFLYETNDKNILSYTYKNVPYKAAIEEQHVWNIFDEFAWWYGLERFEGERNASLLQRCRLQFINRPNSTEDGIRHTILNAANAKTDLLDTDRDEIKPLTEEEIKFLEPDEKTMAKKNQDGITLYEEVSQFNRDIARTRKWDMDYWDNAFRELRYLPHQWDADVNIYRDGVGYHDALKVTTLKNVNQESTTDVHIYGLVRSADEIDTFLRNKNVQQDISLKLTKYNNLLNPVPVECLIKAEDLVLIEHPELIKLAFYRQIREGTYDLEDFVINSGNATVTSNADLQKNTSYQIKFLPKDNSGEALSITKCDLITDGTAESKLEAKSHYVFQGSGIVDKNILFHATKIADFLSSDNLTNAAGAGFALASPLESGDFRIRLKDWANRSFEIKVDPDSGWQDITSSAVYVDTNGFTYDSSKNQYTSAKMANVGDTLTLTFEPRMCRNLSFYLSSDETTQDDIHATVVFEAARWENNREIREVIETRQRIRVNNGTFVTFNNETENDTNRKIIVTIKRRDICAHSITVSQIKRQSYWFNFEIKNGDEVIPHTMQEKRILTLPKNCPANSILSCTIQNGQNPVSPIIQYVHIGPKPTKSDCYSLLINTGNAASYALDIKTNYDVTLINRNTQEEIEHYTTRKIYAGNEYGAQELLLDLSGFDTVYQTIPATRKQNVSGTDGYSLIVDEPIDTIYIQGTGYQENKSIETTLADLASLEPNEKLYAVKSYHGLIKATESQCELVTFSREMLPLSDRIKIITGDPILQACFETDQVQHFANSFDGGFDCFYLYNATAKQYLAYNTYLVVNQRTQTPVINAFSPVPKDMAHLVYRIGNTSPNQDTSIYYMQNNEKRDWTIFRNDTLHIDLSGLSAETIAQNKQAFESNTTYAGKRIQIGNTISLSDIIDDSSLLNHISEYSIVPPDNMEIVYQTKDYTQTSYEDGSALYVELDRFNKLKHANIEKIRKIRINGITYETDRQIESIAKLIPEAGIICWTESAPYGGLIEWIQYTYKEPVSLRYKNIEDLYTIARYPVDTNKNVNIEEYVIENVTDGQEYSVDMSYFSTLPDKIVAVCDNPCFYGTVSDNMIRVSRIAEDNSPVIHNGFYYVNGKEYYFFADKCPLKKDRFDGITIDNASIVDHTLYMYQEAVNYIQNSKMECNHLDIHCIVDFKKPRARTNMDPAGHVGACEAYTMWKDYHVSRNLAAYKNGYATKFTMQDDGYSILDITAFIKGHTTISCLYEGRLKFNLAQEIRILGEQALQSVYCTPAQNFSIIDDIAYCIPNNIDTEQYRYYLVVTGNGTLDEVLFHDFTDTKDIATHHVKAIDKMGFIVEEKNASKNKNVTIEYDSSFMSYNQLETGRDGIVRVGMTADWNITKLHSYNLLSCQRTQCLYRSGAFIAQKHGATIETKPLEIQYRESILKAAIKINQYVTGNCKGFLIKVYSSPTFGGTYTEIGKVENDNLVTFPIRKDDNFIKCIITADEGKVITDIDLFAVYKESEVEDLGIFNYSEGSAVTRIFSIGAVGNYKFNSVECEDGYDQYKQIYVRSIKKAPDEEYVWGEWKDIKDNPIFPNCELFQFKIIIKGIDSKLKIRGFTFEVL